MGRVACSEKGNLSFQILFLGVGADPGVADFSSHRLWLLDLLFGWSELVAALSAFGKDKLDLTLVCPVDKGACGDLEVSGCDFGCDISDGHPGKDLSLIS